jgi:arsenate reductase (thioredoxin)
MEKQKVLFLCIHNSARSQMAQAYLDKYAGDGYQVESAGLEPGVLNPLAIEVMKEDGIDISNNQTKSVHDMYKAGKSYDYVITVCNPAAAESCPVFPGKMQKLNWSFSDPSKFKGTYEESLMQTRIVRDQIKEAVMNFINENKINS